MKESRRAKREATEGGGSGATADGSQPARSQLDTRDRTFDDPPPMTRKSVDSTFFALNAAKVRYLVDEKGRPS